MLDAPIPEYEESLPVNLEAEQAVLGSIFLSEEAFDQADSELIGDEFYLEKHNLIFGAMRRVRDNGEAIDLVTVSEELGSDIGLVGGMVYLTELAGSTPTAANVMYYTRIVKEKAAHRLAIKELQRQLNKARTAESAAEIALGMQTSASHLAERITEKKDTVHIGSALMETFAQIENGFKNRTAGGITGLTSGYHDLDKMLSGFQRTDFIIVAARPSVGKTAFALNIAQSAGKKTNEAIAVFSLEMSTGQLIRRMLCAEANIDAGRMRTGYLEGDDWEKLTMAIGSLSETNIYIDDTAAQTVQSIRVKCQRLKKEVGLGLVIIDYLQLIQAGSRRQNRQEEVTEISRQLKVLAKGLDVPVIALSQLSRGVEQRQDKRPMMSDLRESGALEQDADIVAFLYRDDYYDKESEKKNIIEIIIAKQRNGPVGTVELAFMKNFNKFVNLDHSHREADPHYRPDHEPARGRGA